MVKISNGSKGIKLPYIMPSKRRVVRGTLQTFQMEAKISRYVMPLQQNFMTGTWSEFKMEVKVSRSHMPGLDIIGL